MKYYMLYNDDFIKQLDNNSTTQFNPQFDNNKNPLFAIEVAKSLADAGYDFKMQFIGKGDLLGQMDKRRKSVKEGYTQ